MRKLFNEIGFSLVMGSGNWMIASHEIEEGEDEVRAWGLTFPEWREFKNIYLRIWIWKKVFVFTKSGGWETQSKKKIGIKCILGFQYSLV